MENENALHLQDESDYGKFSILHSPFRFVPMNFSRLLWFILPLVSCAQPSSGPEWSVFPVGKGSMHAHFFDGQDLYMITYPYRLTEKDLMYQEFLRINAKGETVRRKKQDGFPYSSCQFVPSKRLSGKLLVCGIYYADSLKGPVGNPGKLMIASLDDQLNLQKLKVLDDIIPGDTWGPKIFETKDGGYVIAMNEKRYTAIRVIRMNAAFEITSDFYVDKCISDDDPDLILQNARMDKDENLILLATQYVYKPGTDKTFGRSILYKVSPANALIWRQNFETGLYGCYYTQLQVTDVAIYIAGLEQVTEFETDNRYAVCVQRFTKDGQLQWKSKNEEWNLSYPEAMLVEGNTLLLASRKQYAKSATDRSDYAVAMLDTNGKWVSHKEWSTGDYDELRTMYPIADHQYLLIGSNVAHDETEVMRKNIP